MEVIPLKGKILPDELKSLEVRFQLKEEQAVSGEIHIMIRGGKVLKLPVSARTILPKVEILEHEFDFGNITTLGNSTPYKMTLVNKSNIKADLTLDLRGEEEND
jgi:hypothetical protein